MVKHGPDRLPEWRGALLLGLVLVVSGCAAGRSVIKTKNAEPDPLLDKAGRTVGAKDRPRESWVSANPPAGTNPSASPSPSSTPATLAPSPAALAVAPPPRPIEGERDLRIDTPASRIGIRQVGATAGEATLEQAWEALRLRGVTWQQLERAGNEWRFRCSLPSPDNPSINRFYEATAADQLSAVWGVIEKIDGQR
jgi:hypothetical protein